MTKRIVEKLLALRTSSSEHGWSTLFDNVMINEIPFQPDNTYAVGREGDFFPNNAHAKSQEEAIINFLTNDKKYARLFK